MTQRSAARRHEHPRLPYAVAKAVRECQACEDEGARVCAPGWPRTGEPSPWYLAMLCADCAEELRADSGIVVIAVA